MSNSSDQEPLPQETLAKMARLKRRFGVRTPMEVFRAALGLARRAAEEADKIDRQMPGRKPNLRLVPPSDPDEGESEQ